LQTYEKVGKETVGILAQRKSRPNHQIPKANAAQSLVAYGFLFLKNAVFPAKQIRKN